MRGVIEYKYITCCSNACHCCSPTTLSFNFATPALANLHFHILNLLNLMLSVIGPADIGIVDVVYIV